jgi:hypothetical protein
MAAFGIVIPAAGGTLIRHRTTSFGLSNSLKMSKGMPRTSSICESWFGELL